MLDGWYLLQWVRTDDRWQVQLLTWQAETTEHDIEVGPSGSAPQPLPTNWGTVEPIAMDGSTARSRFVLREDEARVG